MERVYDNSDQSEEEPVEQESSIGKVLDGVILLVELGLVQLIVVVQQLDLPYKQKHDDVGDVLLQELYSRLVTNTLSAQFCARKDDRKEGL